MKGLKSKLNVNAFLIPSVIDYSFYMIFILVISQLEKFTN